MKDRLTVFAVQLAGVAGWAALIEGVRELSRPGAFITAGVTLLTFAVLKTRAEVVP